MLGSYCAANEQSSSPVNRAITVGSPGAGVILKLFTSSTSGISSLRSSYTYQERLYSLACKYSVASKYCILLVSPISRSTAKHISHVGNKGLAYCTGLLTGGAIVCKIKLNVRAHMV